ncbi:3-hydroxyacyl-CoA dehydrogenase family protein [Dactylosporangium vinaceum]|uniref:3-hydroxyacyl-CoA dehydrogenase family protein n=1 Tax=Dactylosporangium vinaceum TaxID=53362 RepID=A0ABV5MSZ0_9ACTN|nr:3-hydroxyacyl-CoA dehydrogenase family protein [Dactylosporangium vinaceum]UAB97647.1 3-hydroxyacyl-CoA dehydrogenase family protein [Dactylosporangium vinaceum]
MQTVAVIGAGTVGAALAARFAESGLQVIAVDPDPGPLGRLAFATAAAPGRVRCTVDLNQVAPAELVVEAVPERFAVKASVLRTAHALCPPATVFATTTTALPLARLALAGGRPTRTLGLHPVGPVLELAAGPQTGPEALTLVRAVAERIGAALLPAPARPGLITGALTMAYLNSALTMLDQGYADRDAIDTAMMLGCGLPMGPLAQLDAMGPQVALDTLRELYAQTSDDRYAPPPLLSELVAAGRGLHRQERPDLAERPDGPHARGPVGVLGSGVMAAGIAEVCARAGHPTVIVARTEVKAKEAIAAVERSLEHSVRKGKLTRAALAEIAGRLSGAAGPAALAQCGLVIEAVAEDAAVKREQFRMLDRVCAPGTVLATSTSSLAVAECAAATGRPQDVIGLHFFNPARVMRLVEVASTPLTSEATRRAALAFCAGVGKHAVPVPDRTGFIVNALLLPYLNHAVGLLESGCTSADALDAAVRDGLGWPMGPIELLDVIGLDVALAIQERLHAGLGGAHLAPAATLRALATAGHLGRKTGQGFRRHD